MTSAKEENTVRDLDAIKAILKTIETSVLDLDYEKVRALIPDDGLYFGSVAVKACGYDELKEQQFTRVWPNVAEFRIPEESIDIRFAGDTAWATCLFESTAKGAIKSDVGARKGRMTFVFERRANTWVIIHSHDSLYPTPPPGSS